MTSRTATHLLTYASLPTVDLHCHLRGAMPPPLARSLATKHNLKLPIPPYASEYRFSGFDDFLTLYDQIGHVIRAAEDLREVALEYLRSVAMGGTRYVEFMISPGHSIANGIPFPAQVSAISDAIEQAQEEFGVDACIIVTCVRHRGPEEALEVAELATSTRNPYVRGFGLTGNERMFEIDEFKGAFLIAETSGFGLTAHAGEWMPAATVLKAVNTLNLNRIGHGISVVDDADILAELAERNIGFEVCLSSNVKLSACESYDLHPARKLIDAGCAVTFSTDDPAYFQTSPENEMLIAVRHLKLSITEQWKVFDDSVNMAFCDEKTKERIRRQQ